MTGHKVVSQEEWVKARVAFMAKEKEFTHLREQLAEQRRQLPWVKVEKDYAFQSDKGTVTLADLFQGRSQLVVYHFMFGPDWEEGCKSCSFWADHYDGSIAHLAARDVSLVAISVGPLDRLNAFQKRMGWHFPWVSSANTDFSKDFHVWATPEEIESGDTFYNFTKGNHYGEHMPGMSVFVKDDDGQIFHTYSVYARGLDPVNSAYQILDLTPKGRDEKELPFPMAWVKHHDKY